MIPALHLTLTSLVLLAMPRQLLASDSTRAVADSYQPESVCNNPIYESFHLRPQNCPEYESSFTPGGMQHVISVPYKAEPAL